MSQLCCLSKFSFKILVFQRKASSAFGQQNAGFSGLIPISQNCIGEREALFRSVPFGKRREILENTKNSTQTLFCKLKKTVCSV